MKRTFQVALFGASDAANTKMLVSLHRARGGELAVVPESTRGAAALFFDYDVTDAGVRAHFRIRAVVGHDLRGQAFLGLFGASAVVFVPSGKRDRAAWRAAQAHFATYGDALVLVPSRRPLRGMTRIDAAPGVPLPAVIESQVLAAFRAGRIKGRPTTSPSAAYSARANALAEAVQLAIDIGPRDMRAFHESTRAMALHPELGFATISSLASLETAFFTYWNEGHGAKVDKFWREVARRKLPFKRRNVVGEVLARGRITNRGDYETVTDLLCDEHLTAAQRNRLDAMLGAYEARQVRRAG